MVKMTAEEVADRLKWILDFILSKIAVIIESYQKEASVAEGSAGEQCSKCGSLHPKLIKGNTFMTIQRLAHENLFNPPELRWEERVTA